MFKESNEPETMTQVGCSLQKRTDYLSFQHPSQDAKNNSRTGGGPHAWLSPLKSSQNDLSRGSRILSREVDPLLGCSFVTNKAWTLHLRILTSHSSHSTKMNSENNFINPFCTPPTFCEVHYYYFFFYFMRQILASQSAGTVCTFKLSIYLPSLLYYQLATKI